VVHTGDYKLTGPGRPPRGTDLERLRALGEQGVSLLVGDSTGACEPGRCPGEEVVRAGLDPVFAAASGRIWVSLFASHAERLSTVAELTARHGRRLALVGQRLREHADLAVSAGHLRLPPGIRLGADSLADLPARQAVVALTGTQAEPGSGLWAVARGTHPRLRIAPGDTVVRSARTIPGHEERVSRLLDDLCARGATVVEPGLGEPLMPEPRVGVPVDPDELPATGALHVSGHGQREDLIRLLDLVRPRALLPVHGRPRMLAEHAALARRQGVPQVQVLRNGAVMELTASELKQVGRVPSGRLLEQGSQVGDTTGSELRQRRRLAESGVVVAQIRIDARRAEVLGTPQLTAVGLVRPDVARPLLERAGRLLLETLRELPASRRRDPEQVAALSRRHLRRFFRRQLQRKPVVVPQVVLEPLNAKDREPDPEPEPG
jgi:ribonuclease J